jgi:hypothetical protein
VTSPVAAAVTSPAAVSRSVGSRYEQCGSDETGNEKLHLHNNDGLFFLLSPIYRASPLKSSTRGSVI